MPLLPRPRTHEGSPGEPSPMDRGQESCRVEKGGEAIAQKEAGDAPLLR